MVKKWLIPAVALFLMTSVYPVHAAPFIVLQDDLIVAKHPDFSDGAREDKPHQGKMSRKDFEAYRLTKLREIAAYFGIDSNGKSAEQLKKEVDAAKSADKEKWEAFKAEHQAKRLEHLRKIAEEHGIQTEGKTSEQLREELYKLHGGKGKRPHRLEDHSSFGEEGKDKQQKEEQTQI
ncbi:hypothetical protein D3C78_953440 [compost metagenome]